jgi:hypothetical protein
VRYAGLVSRVLGDDVMTAGTELQVAVPPRCWMISAAKIGYAVLYTGETASYSIEDYLTVLYLMAPKMPIRV